MNEHQQDDLPSENRLPGVRLWLATGLILISLTCLGLVGGFAYYWAESTDFWQRWQALGAPPEKVVGFVTGDINVIYVSTASGGIYGCEHEISVNDSCWQAAQEPLRVDPDVQFDNSVFRGVLKPPRGVIVDELVATLWYADAAFETRYILLEDGTVWKWENDKGLGGLFACIVGPLVGIILGIVATVILWAYVGDRRGATTSAKHKDIQ